MNVFDVSSRLTAWLGPANATFERGRFHVLTLPYFLAAPFKLDDSGAHIEPRFVKPGPDFFAKPAGARELPLPAPPTDD